MFNQCTENLKNEICFILSNRSFLIQVPVVEQLVNICELQECQLVELTWLKKTFH